MNNLLFLIPLLVIVLPVYAEGDDLDVDWIIENQLDELKSDRTKAQIVKNYQNVIESEHEESEKIIYDKFVTNNKYSIGDYKITIDSKEGQILNGILIEQTDLQKENFEHKIKYYDRFSDGYIQIAESLLDPIGEQTYIIKGATYDHNPNSNLEYFVLERGYTLDNLEDVPNDIFSPMKFTLGRELLQEIQRTGEGDMDLRIFSPNYMRLDPDTIKTRMLNTIKEQTTNIQNDIISGKQNDLFSEQKVSIVNSPTQSKNIFDNFIIENPKYEDTQHVRDILKIKSPQPTFPQENMQEFTILLLLPVIVGLIIFGYMFKRKTSSRTFEKSIQVVVSEPIDYRNETLQMIQRSQKMFDSKQYKEAHEKLGRSIRFYYSYKFGLSKEMTNFEILQILKQHNLEELSKIHNWLLICSKVEFAKHKVDSNEFNNIVTGFTKLI